jgi:hypothetical protein
MQTQHAVSLICFLVRVLLLRQATSDEPSKHAAVTTRGGGVGGQSGKRGRRVAAARWAWEQACRRGSCPAAAAGLGRGERLCRACPFRAPCRMARHWSSVLSPRPREAAAPRAVLPSTPLATTVTLHLTPPPPSTHPTPWRTSACVSAAACDARLVDREAAKRECAGAMALRCTWHCCWAAVLRRSP